MTGSVQLQSYQATSASEVSPLINQRGQQAGDGRSLFAKAAAGLGGALVKACRMSIQIWKHSLINGVAIPRAMFMLPLIAPYEIGFHAAKSVFGEQRMQQLASAIKSASSPMVWTTLKAAHRQLASSEPVFRHLGKLMLFSR